MNEINQTIVRSDGVLSTKEHARASFCEMVGTSLKVRSLAVIACSLLCTISVVRAQVINGDMAPPFNPIEEDPAGGSIPTGWSAQGAGAGFEGFYRGQSAQNSPFAGIYGNNSSSFLISDETTGSNNYGMYQNFSGGYASGVAGFDFKMENLDVGYFSMQFGNNGNVVGGTAATMLRFGLNQGGYLTHQGAAAGPTSILQIVSDTWYSVNITFDAINTTFSGTVTPFGESAVGFSGVLVYNTAANFSGVVVRDRTDTPSGDLYLDNVFIVPEPMTLPLLICAVSYLVGRRITRRARLSTLSRTMC